MGAIGRILPQCLLHSRYPTNLENPTITRKERYKTPGNRTPVDLGIEVCWLLAISVIPLAFNGSDVVVFYTQPKDFVLHLAALLIVSLWAIEWALGGYRPLTEMGSWTSFRNWLGWNPRNWALTAAAGFGVAAMISTILSPLPAVSLWGRDFSALGYELYSVLSLLVVFFAVAVRVRDPGQVKRILWAAVGAGAVTGLYGISQRYGWDPIGTGSNNARVLSSFGNPIFFGSYLAMSIVVTLGLALDQARSGTRWYLPLVAVLLGFQLTAMWFTGSRGPWLGVVFGIGAFACLGATFLSRRLLFRAASVLVIGLLIAVLLTNLVPPSSDGQTRGVGSIVSIATSTGEVGLGGVVGGSRLELWQSSARLLDSWEGQQQESGALSTLRPVFGLGPEMYHYSFPLVADPQDGVLVPSHAHNLPLHLVLEYGAAGLFAFVLLALSVLMAGLMTVWRYRRDKGRGGDWLSIAMLTVIASLIGRAVEQSVGVARIGDLILFWMLLGVALAVCAIGSGVRSGIRPSLSIGSGYTRLTVATLLAVVAFAIFFVRDVQMMRAGVVSGDAFAEARTGNKGEAIALLQRAIELAPEVQLYRAIAGELLIEKARAQVTNEAAMPILAEAYETIIPFEERDPFAFVMQLRIGVVEAEMVNRGDGALRDDLIARTIHVADSMPAYPAIQAVAAERVLIAGEIELGLLFANRAIEMEAETSPQPLAWLKRGQALAELGDLDAALESFTIGLSRETKGTMAAGFHRNIGHIYDALGDAELATEHRALADEMDPL